MKNPLSMFEVAGQTALITGASGAFGMVAARILAGAGCNLVLAAGNQAALDEIADECRGLGAEVTAVNARPSDEAACAAMDSLHWDAVVGTLAGEDTFICLTKDESQAVGLVTELKKLLK